MTRTLLLPLSLLLMASGCDSLGYRLQWRGFKSTEKEQPEQLGTEIHLFGPSATPRTAELAWIHWRSQHKDLAHALARNPSSSSVAPYYAKCVEALDQIEREQPERHALLEAARDKYQKLQERAPRTTPQWIELQLRRIEKHLNSLAETST